MQALSGGGGFAPFSPAVIGGFSPGGRGGGILHLFTIAGPGVVYNWLLLKVMARQFVSGLPGIRPRGFSAEAARSLSLYLL